jgi:two-component system alkaline phosphatase synthesis response regulator PhoP
MKVLIIDDDPDVRRIAHLCLSQFGGMQVVEASTSDEGLQQATHEKPDVILLDIMMPRVDGLATLRRLRGNPGTADVPVIFLTAKSADDSEALMRHTGAQGLVSKPFDPTTLANRVRAILEA